jgi:hypothetical protein
MSTPLLDNSSWKHSIWITVMLKHDQKYGQNSLHGVVVLQKLTNISWSYFLPFKEPQRFITTFTRACHWTLTSPNWVRYTPANHISVKAVLILSSYLHLHFPSSLFTAYILTKILYLSVSYMLCPSHSPWFDCISNTWWIVETMKLLIMQLSPSSILDPNRVESPFNVPQFNIFPHINDTKSIISMSHYLLSSV